MALITPPSYLSHVTLIVAPTTTTGSITFSDVEVTQALAPTFAELATTTPVLDRVIADTKVPLDTTALARTIETHVPVGTSLIEISVSNHDPATAAALANSIAEQLAEYQAHGAAQVSALRVSLAVVDPANTPQTPEGLGIPVRTGLGGAIGLMLALSIGFFVENLGRGVRSVGRNLATGGDGEPAPGPVDPPRGELTADRLQRVLGEPARTETSMPMASPLPPVATPAASGGFRPGSSTVLSQTVIRPVLATTASAPLRPPAMERPAMTAPIGQAAVRDVPRPAAPAGPEAGSSVSPAGFATQGPAATPMPGPATAPPTGFGAGVAEDVAARPPASAEPIARDDPGTDTGPRARSASPRRASRTSASNDATTRGSGRGVKRRAGEAPADG